MNRDNPYDLLDLDPSLAPRELTRVLQERARRAGPEERARLQEIWRELTTRESDRIRWALLAHPRPGTASTTSLEALREKVPPTLVRVALAPLEVTVDDALVLPRSDLPNEDPLMPPDILE